MVFQSKGVTCANILGRKIQGVFKELSEILLWLVLVREGREGGER